MVGWRGRACEGARLIYSAAFWVDRKQISAASTRRGSDIISVCAGNQTSPVCAVNRVAKVAKRNGTRVVRTPNRCHAGGIRLPGGEGITEARINQHKQDHQLTCMHSKGVVATDCKHCHTLKTEIIPVNIRNAGRSPTRSARRRQARPQVQTLTKSKHSTQWW